MIAHLSYVMCDGCGNPATPVAEGAKVARHEAKHADGFVRVDGRDLCPQCQDSEGTD